MNKNMHEKYISELLMLLQRLYKVEKSEVN